ncbi:ATP synthase subunit b' [Bienertia sinuspersici]
METLNPYERSRMQRVQECKARLLNSGIVDIKKSLTSLVDSQKNEKRKKNLKVADNGDADYGPNLDSSGDEDEEEEEDRVTTPTRHSRYASVYEVCSTSTLKRYVNLTKHQRQGGGKSEKRKAPTVGELILKNKQLPREALMENTIALDGETGDQTLNEANLDWLSELDERANANRGMDELMAESENESDEESAAEEHERESDIDADVLDGLSESDEDENNTNDLDDRAIKELQIQGETKRGPTMLHKVHMRSFEKREAIILNEFGQPIGPVTPEKDTVGEFSRFLGTIARDYGTAPLLHKTWKLVPSKEKMWEYVLEAMKNYTPPDDGSGPKDPYLGVMGKEYTGRRRLYGRGVTNKVLHKVASSSVNYVVPDEVMDALRADIQNEKTEIVDMRKELEADYERKKAELEANYAKKMEEFDKTKDKMVQDVLEKLISKLPTNVVREFLT